MMQPEDVEQIIHYSEIYHRHDHKTNADVDCGGPHDPYPQRHPYDSLNHTHTNHTHAHHTTKRPFPPPPPATSRAFRHRPQPHQPCDGTVCNNFCPTARAWSAANPVVFTWHQSPELAVVGDGGGGGGGGGGYAVLVCRNQLQDAAESEQQNRRIVANTLALREREKERERLKLAAARRTAETIHISPVVDEAGGAASVSTPSSSGAAGTEGVLLFDDMGSFDRLVNHCGGVSAQDLHHLHAVREQSQQSQHGEESDNSKPSSSFSAVVLRESTRCSTTPLAPNSHTNDLHTSPTTTSSTTSLSSSSLSHSLSPAPPIEVPMSVSVNPAFERLFGYSQAELRQHLIRDGGRALYLLTRSEDWERLMELDQEATWGREHEYRTYAVIVNKW